MDFIIITDTFTGKTLTVTQPCATADATITDSTDEPTKVKSRSVRKAIKTWMKERKREGK